MANLYKSKRNTHENSGWRNYQTELQRNHAMKKMSKKILKYSPIVPIVLAVFYGIITIFSGTACQNILSKTGGLLKDKTGDFQDDKQGISKNEVQLFIDAGAIINRKSRNFTVDHEGRKLRVDTTIDIDLQEYLLKKLDRKNSRYIGIVAIDPDTGRVLVMAGFDKTNASKNTCIDSMFPAASVFKIVSAAAVVEKCGFKADTRFSYNGSNHTLYKRQLKDRKNRYTNYITLRDSFARSVNPVFGKIGANYLGKTSLEKYADAFGFNQTINFELPLSPSPISFSDDLYNCAEIACGFNRETQLSPVHGALISSAVLNRGVLIEPTVIDQIVDEKGQVIYKSGLKKINHAISLETADILKDLMGTTIRAGTCRKSFSGYRKDRILSKLNIGGKTGSIASRSHDVRYDWFVGYAEEKKGEQKLALAIVVAHEKYIGRRSFHYARYAIKEYFRKSFAERQANNNDVQRSGRTRS